MKPDVEVGRLTCDEASQDEIKVRARLFMLFVDLSFSQDISD